MWQKYKKRILSIGIACVALLALILYHLPEHSEYLITYVDLNTGEQHSLTLNFVRFRKLFVKINYDEWALFSGKARGIVTLDGTSYGQTYGENYESTSAKIGRELRELRKMVANYDPDYDPKDGEALSFHFQFESDTTMGDLYVCNDEYVYIPQIDDDVYGAQVWLRIYEAYYPEPAEGRAYSLKTTGDELVSHQGKLTDIRRVRYIPFSLQKNPIR